jgi:virginiamycin B lyase
MANFGGPLQRVWFTEYNVGKIGYITSEGEITEMSVLPDFQRPSSIVVARDGSIWFNGGFGKLGRYVP